MTTKISVSIPEPCHENWQAMTVVEKGRFCASCQKNVFDFTTSSDRQIIDAFNKNENLCGRFNTSQLNRELIIPKEKSSIWLATTAAIVSFLGLGNQEITAQEKTTTEQTDKKAIAPINTGEEKEITGIVNDETGPLPAANVVIKGTTIGVQTDLDGKFSIKAKEGDILVFSFIGMTDKELIIGKLNSYKINLDSDCKSEARTTVMGGILKRKDLTLSNQGIVDNNKSINTGEEREITGIVSDGTYPIPTVNVVIKDTQIDTQTDFDGKFSIKAKDGDVLVFSFLGMNSQEIIIRKSNTYELTMTEAVTGGITLSKKRTFLGRIFHKIGNLFR